MQPTMKLRYVQRGWKNVTHYGHTGKEPVYVLQQLWEGEMFVEGTELKHVSEWRDVPIEVES